MDDRSYHPPLLFRWSYYGENSRDPAFAARLRVNTVTDDAKLGGRTGQSLIGHSFGTQIPTSKYGKDHPEYFALRDGKRLSSGNDWYESQPCLTHPDVLDIVTRAVLDELKAHPERVRDVLRRGAERCRALAAETMTRVREIMGFVPARA